MLNMAKGSMKNVYSDTFYTFLSLIEKIDKKNISYPPSILLSAESAILNRFNILVLFYCLTKDDFTFWDVPIQNTDS